MENGEITINGGKSNIKYKVLIEPKENDQIKVRAMEEPLYEIRPLTCDSGHALEKFKIRNEKRRLIDGIARDP